MAGALHAGPAVAESLGEAVKAGTIAKHQITPRRLVVYLRELAPGRPLRIPYRLQATMPVRITVPPARVYEHYAPSREGKSEPVTMQVASAT